MKNLAQSSGLKWIEAQSAFWALEALTSKTKQICDSRATLKKLHKDLGPTNDFRRGPAQLMLGYYTWL